MEKRLFLTGASGLLGRSVRAKLLDEGWEVFAAAFSRTKGGFHKLDITDEGAVKKAIATFKPSIIIHSAAQRYPDLVEKDPDLAHKLNVTATRFIAEAAESVGCRVIYISTDYVFDGKCSPYSIDDQPNPVNLYGKTKLQGEIVVTGVNSKNIVLRVPVLYGPVEQLSESAVTVLLELLLNTSKTVNLSHYERRRPSHVDDIAIICFQVASELVKGKDICGIVQWCGSEELTKYDMVMRMSEIFGLPHDHIQPVTDAGSSSTPRPYNTTLDTSKLTALGFGHHTPFNDGIKKVLAPWIKK